MDPNENLKQQLALARGIIEHLDTQLPETDGCGPNGWAEYDEAKADRNEAIVANAELLAPLVIALDEWLSRGGFKPTRWFTG